MKLYLFTVSFLFEIYRHDQCKFTDFSLKSDQLEHIFNQYEIIPY